MIHLVGINVSGVSVNPARSIGPALFEGGRALAQLWLFILAPLAGGALAGALYAAGFTRADG
jgi:aquaporin Z